MYLQWNYLETLKLLPKPWCVWFFFWRYSGSWKPGNIGHLPPAVIVGMVYTHPEWKHGTSTLKISDVHPGESSRTLEILKNHADYSPAIMEAIKIHPDSQPAIMEMLEICLQQLSVILDYIKRNHTSQSTDKDFKTWRISPPFFLCLSHVCLTSVIQPDIKTFVLWMHMKKLK